MDAEDGRRVGDVLLMTGEGFFDVQLFEFAEGLVKKDVAFQHLLDEVFETIMNQSSFPVRSLYAST